MKIVITVVISMIVAIGIFLGYRYYQDLNEFRSPLPGQDGIKVIIVSPEPLENPSDEAEEEPTETDETPTENG